jgi:hypothetical protein
MFTTHMTILAQYDHRNNVDNINAYFLMNVEMHIPIIKDSGIPTP